MCCEILTHKRAQLLQELILKTIFVVQLVNSNFERKAKSSRRTSRHLSIAGNILHIDLPQIPSASA